MLNYWSDANLISVISDNFCDSKHCKRRETLSQQTLFNLNLLLFLFLFFRHEKYLSYRYQWHLSRTGCHSMAMCCEKKTVVGWKYVCSMKTTLDKGCKTVVLLLLHPSVLWHCWLSSRKSIQPIKSWVIRLGAGMEWSANDLHVAQLMPLPPIISCFIKIQNSSAFLVPVYPGCPRKWLVRWMCDVKVKDRVPSKELREN